MQKFVQFQLNGHNHIMPEDKYIEFRKTEELYKKSLHLTALNMSLNDNAFHDLISKYEEKKDAIIKAIVSYTEQLYFSASGQELPKSVKIKIMAEFQNRNVFNQFIEITENFKKIM